MKCRHCGTPLNLRLVDLGSAPPSNAYLTEGDLKKPEMWFPLRILVCLECWLVQTDDFTGAEEIFTDSYAYFSSYSKSWLDHAENYVAMAVDQFKLDERSMVIELAANDGYLLQFVAARNIPCIGIEPTTSTAASARSKGLEIIVDFFGARLAKDLLSKSISADLVVANNVLAHVPDINDFVSGVSTLLKRDGIATFEFPHFLNLVTNNQFDTIYHEHYSYLSFTAVNRVFDTNGLSVFDVEEIPTHGGSLRVYAQRSGGSHSRSSAVERLRQYEETSGITSEGYYSGFQSRADKAKDNFLRFLLDTKQSGKKVAAYGAAAKGNTFLNYAGLRPDLLPYVVDKSPSKKGKFLPGSRIPIVDETLIVRDRPDYVIILPWNIQDEVSADLAYIKEWGGRFVVAIPELRVF
jgi:SAM-dependent methyltransferase